MRRQYKSDPVLFAALTDSAAIIRALLRELRQETERRREGNRRAAQEYVEGMRDVLKEAAQICKDLDDEALAKENRLACGAECAAAIEAYMRKIFEQTTTAPVYVSRSMLNAARKHGAAIGATIYGQQQDSSAGEMVALYEGQK